MNKRQWKKYCKKGFNKKWYNTRRYKLEMEARKYAIVVYDWSPFGIGVEIKDSKRGNLKHPLEVAVERVYHTVLCHHCHQK